VKDTKGTKDSIPARFARKKPSPRALRAQETFFVSFVVQLFLCPVTP
jgi:hypothetical protein